jgi:hypothetical protein
VGGRLGFPLIFARVEAPPRSLPFCFLAVACGILQVVRVFQGLLAVLRALCLSLLGVLCDSSSFFFVSSFHEKDITVSDLWSSCFHSLLIFTAVFFCFCRI